MLNGCGGQPGIKRSTGKKGGLRRCALRGDPTYGPAGNRAGATAIHSFGQRNRVIGPSAAQAACSRGTGPVINSPSAVRGEADELDAEATRSQATVPSTVGVGFAGIATAGAGPWRSLSELAEQPDGMSRPE